MAHYVVMCSDPRRRHDHRVARRVNRQAAAAVAAERNRAAVRARGAKAELYFVVRVKK